MDARQLKLFLAVLDSPTMTKASERMHLSTAAVSIQLHSLADELKTDLFVRSGRRLIPTPAARKLEQRARIVLSELQSITEDFEDEAVKDARPFHLASGATTLIYRLSGPLRLLRNYYPKMNLHVTVADTEEIVSGVLDRRFDLGLISLPYPHPDISVIPLFDEELLLLRPTAVSTRGSRVGTIRAAELDGAPMLLYPRNNMRMLMDDFFRGLGVAPQVIMEASDTEVIKCLVEAGFGYSMLPEYALRSSVGFFQTLRVSGHRLIRKQALAMLETARHRSLTEEVATFLKDHLNSQAHPLDVCPSARRVPPHDKELAKQPS